MAAYQRAGAAAAEVAAMDVLEQRDSAALATVRWIVRSADGVADETTRRPAPIAADVEPNRPSRSSRVLFHLVDPGEGDEEFSPIENYLPLIQMMWLDVVHGFGLDELLVVDQTSGQWARNLYFEGLKWSRYASLADAEAANPDTRWVYFEQGGQPLTDFVHPGGDVIYAFGPDTVGLAHEPGKTYVEIPTVRPWAFFSPLAAAIVFADRFTRQLRSPSRDDRR